MGSGDYAWGMGTENLDLAPVADAALGQEIPVIDMAEPHANVVEQVARACAEWGFFQIVNHGLDPTLLERAATETREFFAAPKASKRELTRSRDNPWGYFDRELTKNARDKKEIFDIGPDAECAINRGPFRGATQWPAWRPSFKKTLRDYFTGCVQTSERLVSLLCEGLGAPADRLAKAFGDCHTSFLRLNYYPVEDPLAGEANDVADLGIHHHTDAGAVTVLQQDQVRGLQVYREGLWYDVQPLAGAFVINIGDMVQVWSNDRYRAPVHRVQAMKSRERLSMAFFFNPDYATVVAPLENLVDATHPAHFSGIPWEEFRRRRADGDFADYGAEVQIANYRV